MNDNWLQSCGSNCPQGYNEKNSDRIILNYVHSFGLNSTEKISSTLSGQAIFNQCPFSLGYPNIPSAAFKPNSKSCPKYLRIKTSKITSHCCQVLIHSPKVLQSLVHVLPPSIMCCFLVVSPCFIHSIEVLHPVL